MSDTAFGTENVCEHCRRLYKPTRRARRFCSLDCFYLNRRRSAPDRFWEKVDRSGDCWVWTAHIHHTGYGYFQLSSHEPILAHRMSWILNRGPIPDDLCVLHRCDNRPCVKPEHLWLGTVADNNTDKTEKGRTISLPGSANHNAKLTESAVRNIRQRFAAGSASRQELADEHGVLRDTVNKVISRRLWKHV